MPVPQLVATLFATAVATAPVAPAVISAQSEAKSQKKMLQFQEDQVNAAEAKTKAAEALATQTATEKLKKQRLAQTQTILTSPLGITDQATTGRATLLGG
jgi:hypothetical protein